MKILFCHNLSHSFLYMQFHLMLFHSCGKQNLAFVKTVTTLFICKQLHPSPAFLKKSKCPSSYQTTVSSHLSPIRSPFSFTRTFLFQSFPQCPVSSVSPSLMNGHPQSHICSSVHHYTFIFFIQSSLFMKMLFSFALSIPQIPLYPVSIQLHLKTLF